jgi:hypothetical protein
MKTASLQARSASFRGIPALKHRPICSGCRYCPVNCLEMFKQNAIDPLFDHFAVEKYRKMIGLMTFVLEGRGKKPFLLDVGVLMLSSKRVPGPELIKRSHI